MTAGALWVFHRGALGDSVLLWPVLRAARARGRAVTLVTDGSKARLAQTELGITGLDTEQPRFNALWRKDPPIEPIAGIAEAWTFDASGGGASSTWIANAVRMFPGAAIRTVRQRPDRHVVADLVRALGGEAPVPERPNPSGPVVVHAGAGSPGKRWPFTRFADLVVRLRQAGLTVRLIAGEAEADRFTARERTGFERSDGHFLTTLDDLAGAIRPARLFIGCDTGPTHLAAQLGVTTLALFGPTRTETWGPAGPRVRMVNPEGLAAITWLHPSNAFDAAAAVLRLRAVRGSPGGTMRP